MTRSELEKTLNDMGGGYKRDESDYCEFLAHMAAVLSHDAALRALVGKLVTALQTLDRDIVSDRVAAAELVEQAEEALK